MSSSTSSPSLLWALQVASLQDSASRLRQELEQAQASGRQEAREASATQNRLQELKLELASAQGSHKESMALVCILQ